MNYLRSVEVRAEAPQSTGLRCLCPVCLRLDARFPDEGFQLALFPYRPKPVVVRG